MNDRSRPKAASASTGEEAHVQGNRPRRQWWVSTGPRSGYSVDVEIVATQVIRDAFRDALSAQWRYRAERLCEGLQRPGDYPGRLTPQQAAERDQRIREDVRRTLQHVRLLEHGDPYDDDLRSVLCEVSR